MRTNVGVILLFTMMFLDCTSGKTDREIDARLKNLTFHLKKDNDLAKIITTYYDSVNIEESKGHLHVVFFLGPQENFINFDSAGNVIVIHRKKMERQLT